MWKIIYLADIASQWPRDQLRTVLPTSCSGWLMFFLKQETTLPGEIVRPLRIGRTAPISWPRGRPWPCPVWGPLHSPSNNPAPASQLGQRENHPARGVWPPGVCLIRQFPFGGSQDAHCALDGRTWIRYMLSLIREAGGSLSPGKQVGARACQCVRVRAASNGRGPDAGPDGGQTPGRVSSWPIIRF